MSENTIEEKIEKSDFIRNFAQEDLKGELNKIHTRVPPEPNGYLHIGHAKSILYNYNLAREFGGTFNLRFDDTNPAKESDEFVQSIKKDLEWLGAKWDGDVYFASNYFDQMYDLAVKLIKDGKAFVCELTQEQMNEYRGNFQTPGKESPYRNRSVEENLRLFEEMKDGKHKEGAMTLRAKIDMSAGNINMRDPIIYRIQHVHHHNTGDKWCIYPMYDYAHPLEDAIEGITHSICTLEFEDHRPLYNWYVENTGFDPRPRQIEFAKLSLTNAIMGKRYLKQLVDDGKVDGWDDPRMLTISGLRRRGYTPEALADFCNRIGISKADNRVEIALLEHCVREDLKEKSETLMAVLDPIKVVITNYDENAVEMLEVANNPHNEEDGTHEVPFCREIYIDRADFMEDAPSKFFRMKLGGEVRLRGAYFVLCNEVVKDEAGNVVELRCTYDPETKSGSGFTGRKVKGTIHWVSARHAVDAVVRDFDYLVLDDPEAEKGVRENETTIIEYNNAKLEPIGKDVKMGNSYQFIRTGYYCLDSKLSSNDNLVFNCTVSLKSSFKL